MAGKQITSATLTGERGVNLVAGQVMEMGFVWYPTGSVEAGIDGYIELRDANTGEVLNAHIEVQCKAVEHSFLNETNHGFDFYCEARDIEYWLKSSLPMLLIVSRPSSNEAYWVSIKDYFSDPAHRGSRKVHFEKSHNRFNVSCRDALINLAVSAKDGVYVPPLPKQEILISNLLHIAFLPHRIYMADTTYRDIGALRRDARQLGVHVGGEWILRNGRILGFRNLQRPEWLHFCDQGTVEDFATDEWSQTTDADRQREFVMLLRQTLRQMVAHDLGFHEQRDLFYFRATPDLSPRDIDYKGLSKATDRTVFKAYCADDGTVKYYRHSAFNDKFFRFDEKWYLEITPTYHFTSDGYKIRRNYHRFLKRIKEIEGHGAIRGQVVMWAAFLTPGGDMFNDALYPFLGFGDLVRFEVNEGIDDTAWNAPRQREPKPSNSLGNLPLFGAGE